MSGIDTSVTKQDLFDKKNYTIDLPIDGGVVVTSVDTSTLGKRITDGQLAYLLENALNVMPDAFGRGQRIGRLLCQTHRTLQGCAVNMMLGILCGFAETDEKFTDPRNEYAIKIAKKVADLVNTDGIQLFI